MPLVIGVLGSGAGTNFQAIVDAIAAGTLANVRVGVALSDQEDAGMLQRACAAGVPAQWVDPGPYKTKLDPDAEARYIGALHAHHVDLVVLAGFMRVLKGEMLSAFPQRILNIHPSLLPAFRGLAAWEQALAAGVKLTGCTVHVVDAKLDHGPILAQAAVPVEWDDTPDTLQARIQVQEHQLYPAVIQGFADGRVTIEGGRVRIAPVTPAPAAPL